MKKNGAFLFGISFFALEIFTFLCYANEESDDIRGGSTVIVQHGKFFSPEILKRCFSNLAPAMYITKERK